jgi:hypothetical protein
VVLDGHQQIGAGEMDGVQAFFLMWSVRSFLALVEFSFLAAISGAVTHLSSPANHNFFDVVLSC